MGNNLGNKRIMAQNIEHHMRKHQISRKDLSDMMGVPYTTICSWLNPDTYPRIDKIEKMAQIFGISKSDLVEEQSSVEKTISNLPFYNEFVSAGSGWLLEGYEYEFCEFENAPANSDFALRIRGDSMSPNFNDNDIVFVRQGVHIESGQVGVWCINGEGYLKMLQGNKLVSYNSKYEPIVINEFDRVFPAGRVVGRQVENTK